MTDRELTKVYTRDLSSGRVHVRIYVNGALLVDERDNLDQAGEFEEVDESVLTETAPDRLCERCFPRDAA